MKFDVRIRGLGSGFAGPQVVRLAEAARLHLTAVVSTPALLPLPQLRDPQGQPSTPSTGG